MKKLIFFLLLFITLTAEAQVKDGDPVPDINFTAVLNAKVKSAQLSRLKGKIVLVEFWATWCGSCLVAMPHLNALQAKFPNTLQVIAVTDETAKRAGMYIKAKPANFWFDADTSRKIADMFPHRLIPHTILISPEGKLIAATSPELVTEQVIDSVLRHQTVHLVSKVDNMVKYEDLISQNFAAADTVQNRFMMQGEIKGGPGLSTTWLNSPAFAGRRLTGINLPLSTLYMMANGNYAYSRTLDQTQAGNVAPTYCVDLIVPTHADLLPTLQKELAKRFDLQAKVEPMKKNVQVLRIVDQAKFNAIPRNQSGKRTYSSSHGAIDEEDMTMADFAQFLEDYGTGKLTVDDTHNLEKLDIKFTFQPENPQSLLNILSGMGLGLTKEQRNINILVLYKPSNSSL